MEKDEIVQSCTALKRRGLQVTSAPVMAGLPLCILWWALAPQEEGQDSSTMPLVAVALVGAVQLVLALASYWSVHLHAALSYKQVKDPSEATTVKVVPLPNNGSSELVPLRRTRIEGEDEVRLWFIFQKLKYVYDRKEKKFRGVNFPIDKCLSEYLHSKGLQDDGELERTELDYGKNILDMDIPEFMELFKERATAPFFVFQVFCMGLWCLDKYWYYSIFTLAMLVTFECTLVKQQLRNMADIRKMGNKPYDIQVYRNRRWRHLCSDQLVPGDIVSIIRSTGDYLVPCDILLLRGACIVDESMLTGESVPQMKEPLESEMDERVDKLLDLDGENKINLLFGGTKVIQHTPPNKQSATGLRAPDNGCIGYVLRTGFNTSQGKLLRTILFGVKRVTANNLETFGFILFLLIFAVAAAAYVWVKGSEDPERNRYRLFLECTLILTSVVPPELPIELSLAVNNSLFSLYNLGVFCTEPFRIPFAGKIDVCCFDKTGTLTSDNLLVEGVAGVKAGDPHRVLSLSEAPVETVQVLATCHSLVQLDDGIVGDPLEKATLAATDWTLTKSDVLLPKKTKSPKLKIFHRYHFSSALKRMSVLTGYQIESMGTIEVNYLGTVKGAPEVLKNMFTDVPKYYDDTYLTLSRRGARVLALGFKDLGKISNQDIKNVTRESLECDLKFVGFVVISCPLKTDSKRAINELLNASHSVAMITGDNPLTACHVAKELSFTVKSDTLVFTKRNEDWEWRSIDEMLVYPIKPNEKLQDYINQYDLCITGDGLSYLIDNQPEYLSKVLPYVKVFARFDPKQKEFVILHLKSLGYSTLMCGDGTNDVGALKHAEVGVAILANAPERMPDKKEKSAKEKEKRRIPGAIEQREKLEKLNSVVNHNRNHLAHGNNQDPMQNKINKLLKEMEDLDKVQVVKLGDASIASPFTSRLSSIMCVCHIIKQGRCTLVTTLQMFKILALNALILAYSQSVLYLDGIKFSDTQATLQGLLLASCFLFISRSKPLNKLSRQRPLPNIFNVYTIMTVLLQFMVHFLCLIFLVREATARSPPREGKVVLALDLPDDVEEEFAPDLLNSTVYIISMILQISTFAINYRGEPYMESLSANRPLLLSILISGGAVFALALGLVPDLSAQLEIVPFPTEFKIILIQVLVADMVFSFLVDRICLWLFSEGKLKTPPVIKCKK